MGGAVAGPSLEFHSLLSVELEADCLARKQRGMVGINRQTMMKILRLLRVILKCYNWEVVIGVS